MKSNPFVSTASMGASRFATIPSFASMGKGQRICMKTNISASTLRKFLKNKSRYHFK